jgi:ribosomal protein S18 acetylase RimI-like enzyme
MRLIRPAKLHDLPGIYRVCLLTGAAGLDASAQFRNPDLLGHVFVGPYVVGQPDFALVVVDPEGVAGYCLAARDTRAFEAWAEASWWPPLRDQYPVPVAASPDGVSPDAEIIRLLHSPPRAPDAIVREFPAHVHIDLLARARGHGHGRELIERQLASLRREGARGVHLDVAAGNANAIAFYRHLGFTEVEQHETSILMGMRLP